MWVPMAVALVLGAGGAERPKIAVMDFTAAGGADAALASSFSESVAVELSRRGVHEVVTARDIATLLGIERQKQLLECGEESESCMTEVASALGAQFVITGSLSQLGSSVQLNLQTVDSHSAKSVARASRLASDPGELRAALPWLVAEATNLPAPAARSRVVPYSLIGGGSALLVGGAIFGLQAVTLEQQLLTELRAADERGARLDSATIYESRSRTHARDKTIGLAAALTGAGLLATGFIWSGAMGPAGSGGAVALVPTERGAVLSFVGVLP